MPNKFSSISFPTESCVNSITIVCTSYNFRTKFEFEMKWIAIFFLGQNYKWLIKSGVEFCFCSRWQIGLLNLRMKKWTAALRNELRRRGERRGKKSWSRSSAIYPLREFSQSSHGYECVLMRIRLLMRLMVPLPPLAHNTYTTSITPPPLIFINCHNSRLSVKPNKETFRRRIDSWQITNETF